MADLNKTNNEPRTQQRPWPTKLDSRSFWNVVLNRRLSSYFRVAESLTLTSFDLFIISVTASVNWQQSHPAQLEPPLLWNLSQAHLYTIIFCRCRNKLFYKLFYVLSSTTASGRLIEVTSNNMHCILSWSWSDLDFSQPRQALPHSYSRSQHTIISIEAVPVTWKTPR